MTFNGKFVELVTVIALVCLPSAAWSKDCGSKTDNLGQLVESLPTTIDQGEAKECPAIEFEGENGGVSARGVVTFQPDPEGGGSLTLETTDGKFTLLPLTDALEKKLKALKPLTAVEVKGLLYLDGKSLRVDKFKVTGLGEAPSCEPCDPTLICGMAMTCVDGQLYPTTCGPRNCAKPTGPCTQDEGSSAQAAGGETPSDEEKKFDLSDWKTTWITIKKLASPDDPDRYMEPEDGFSTTRDPEDHGNRMYEDPIPSTSEGHEITLEGNLGVVKIVDGSVRMRRDFDNQTVGLSDSQKEHLGDILEKEMAGVVDNHALHRLAVTELRKVDAQTKASFLAAYEKARNGLAYRHGTTLPEGVLFKRVELKRDPYVDGFTYTALVPLAGPGSSAPFENLLDADSFYVERAGGIAGLIQYAGPISYNATATALNNMDY